MHVVQPRMINVLLKTHLLGYHRTWTSRTRSRKRVGAKRLELTNVTRVNLAQTIFELVHDTFNKYTAAIVQFYQRKYAAS